jgi:hypothetical protein
MRNEARIAHSLGFNQLLTDARVLSAIHPASDSFLKSGNGT